MNIRHAILTATLVLVASTAQAKQPPITFARSGKTVSVALVVDKDRPVQSVVLRAYGRVWTKPAKKAVLIDKQDRSNVIWLIDVPTVRVPAVFHITPVKDAKRTLGELVAYPDRNVEWDEKIILYSAGAPKWFNQWVEATGLPVKKVNLAEFISCISNVRRVRPEGPIDVSRGRKPPVGMPLLIKPRRGERALFAMGSVAPPGLDGLGVLSGGLRPRLISVAPLGLTKTDITEINNPVNRRKPKDKKHVLVIGRKTAGRDFWSTLAIAKKHKINVLVLEAKWFGGKSGKVTIQPKQMAGGLAELRKQKWSKPLTFRSHRKPWPGIANRWAWISDKEGLPLVERVWAQAGTDKPNSVILLNYVSWQEQLGRRDVADLTLLKVLSSAAKKIRKPHWRMPDVLYPTPKVLEETEKQRPVLAAASKAWIAVLISDIPPRTYVIDLRGKESPPAGFRKTLKWLENRNDSEAPLLILGDDPLLDDWKWAGINRKKKKFKRGGIAWLTDDTLPPSVKNQIRLMLKLTELGIPLKPLEPLKREKKDEKPNK